MDKVEESQEGPDPMEWLRQRGLEGASLRELSQILGGDPLETSRHVMTLIENGEPIGFPDECEVGTGAVLCLSDETKVFLANRPDELGGTMNLLAAQIDDLNALQYVLGKTESHLRKRIDAENGR